MFTQEEFVLVAQKYMDTVFRVAYGYTKNSADADDVTQDVLIRLYQYDKEFESEQHLKNWLMRVTINCCKMIFRVPWRNHESIDQYAETLGFKQKEYLELFTAVMALERKYRLVILLYYYEGYSTSEIASLLGIAENTVSVRLFRARAKLKNILTEV